MFLRRYVVGVICFFVPEAVLAKVILADIALPTCKIERSFFISNIYEKTITFLYQFYALIRLWTLSNISQTSA